MLNGQAVTFEVKPVLLKGTTYVEFRSLFKQLGYTVAYESKSKTIKAQSQDHSIQMSVGGDMAFVDGKSVPVKGQVQVISGHTMVGVRFIAALSGKDVAWQSASSTVQITDAGPSEEQKEAISSVFNKLLLTEAANDPAGMLQLFTSDSPTKALIEPQIEELKKTPTRTEYLERKIQSFSEQQATVITKEHTVGADGVFYFGNTAEVKYILHPTTDGQWQIYQATPVSIEYDSPEAYLDQAVSVPEADKSAIDALLKAQNDAYNAEDIDAFRATVAPFDGLDQAIDLLETTFAQTDISFTLEKTAIVSFKEDHAVVVQQKLLELKAQGVKARLIQGNELVKKDGKWLFDKAEYVLKQEQL